MHTVIRSFCVLAALVTIFVLAAGQDANVRTDVVASAGPDVLHIVGDTVVLDASGSLSLIPSLVPEDGDGAEAARSLSYRWTQTEGEDVALSTTDGPLASFVTLACPHTLVHPLS